tara:strand:- start:4756 stop:5586 length:831 start_codon:yes stop_codon:yes gene_type:complete
MKRSDVRRLQELLVELNYDPGPIDGLWGSRTALALNQLHQEKLTKPQMIAEKWSFDVPGIDISAWKPAAAHIDWDKLSAYGFGFAYLKATQDDNYKSKKFRGHQAGFRDIGVDTGLYHYGDYEDNNKVGPERAARAEAEWFSKVAGDNVGVLAPMLDVESGFDKSDDEANAVFILEWCRIIAERYGKAGIYTAGWAWNLYLKRAPKSMLDEITELPLWWARYKPSLDNLKGWKRAHIWQWSGKSKVDGIEKNGKHVLCDRNWSSEQALKSLRLDDA